MKSYAEFFNLYRSRLLPALYNLEPARKDALFALLTSVFFILIAAGGFLLFSRSGKAAGLAIALPPLVFGIYSLYRYSRKKSAYAEAFKEQVIREMVALIDPGLHYFPQRHIAQSDYRQADIFRASIDRFHGDDLVEGTLGATYCRFSELHHQEKRESTDSKGRRRTHWVTVFKGLFFVADFNKHLHGRTYIVPDAGTSLLGIGKLFEKWRFDKGELVELENPEFEKLFTVYGTDQVEARYILSPSMMERLVGFRRRANTRLHLSFIGSNLYLAIALNKNLFEPNLFSSGVKSGYLKDYFRYLDLVTGLVEDLNLNLRIWGKT
ncbi:DUF3137 domain-containing protein [Methylosarcina fibrata]|uniref:DUF3137 domain-containing protein n=1 Tax=Methylosarcina fibrata TaxID=105972 RepID=UPI000380A574|nr:DUF3137 domain-containing protein [Methylosarcina fibrata]